MQPSLNRNADRSAETLAWPTPAAEAPRASAGARAALQPDAGQRRASRTARLAERQSVARGLVWTALLVLGFELARAGWSRAFPQGVWPW